MTSTPVYVSGDANNSGMLDPTEVWLYSSASVKSFQATNSEFYGNIATVTVTNASGDPVTASDPAYLLGTTPRIFVQKAINAVNPMSPTPAELAVSTPRLLPVGTPVVWTYQVTDLGDAPVKVTSVRDDNGTPGNLADDFSAVAVLQAGTSFNVGDTNQNSLLDPGEVFLFTSAGVSSGSTTELEPGVPECPGLHRHQRCRPDSRVRG